MKRFLNALAITLVFCAAPSSVPAREDAAAGGTAPLQINLTDAIRAAFKNNKDMKVDSFAPEFRENDLLFQKALFDASVTTSGSYTDASQPSLNVFDVGQTGSVSGVDSTQTVSSTTYQDPLRIGSDWSANLLFVRSTSTSGNSVFPEAYFSQLEFRYNQPFLRNFGRKVNETEIVVAQNNKDISKQNFRTRVNNTLLEVEGAYWTLVYARQNLEVTKEALRLAQELLKLNQIKVQVGTLPPIDITLAEAGVASREEAVIIAEAAIQNAEDRLRRAMGMDPLTPEWRRPLVPVEDLAIVERRVDLDSEVKTAMANRTDIASAQIVLKNADLNLAFQRNQLKYSLNGSVTYTLQGLSGDTSGNAALGIGPRDDGLLDAWEFIPKRDFPTYEFALTLGIPIGNRAAESLYTNSRLRREQAAIAYQNFEQLTQVEVGVAVRRVQTDMKRIEAAEKNRILQEKKVEAEQKKYENGMSTSFQVLEFQKDLAEARSSENLAKSDYRVSLASLDNVTGVLDKSRNVRIEDYARN